MEELEESELGTQEYWDNRYAEEIKNFDNHGDPGEIWFGEDIVDRIIQWMNSESGINKSDKLVDIGCGNGMFLINLAIAGYTNLNGVDYSEPAIELAKSVAGKHNVTVNFFVGNIISGLEDHYDIIHDKGTYDAISLSLEAKHNRNIYLQNINKILNDNGFFIITSCNWTDSELKEQFKEYFQCFHVIPTPQFKFGGKVGNVVSSVVFKKRCN